MDFEVFMVFNFKKPKAQVLKTNFAAHRKQLSAHL